MCFGFHVLNGSQVVLCFKMKGSNLKVVEGFRFCFWCQVVKGFQVVDVLRLFFVFSLLRV